MASVAEGLSGCPPTRRSAVRSPVFPICMPKCPWARCSTELPLIEQKSAANRCTIWLCVCVCVWMCEWLNCNVKRFEWPSRLEKLYINTNHFLQGFQRDMKPPLKTLNWFWCSTHKQFFPRIPWILCWSVNGGFEGYYQTHLEKARKWCCIIFVRTLWGVTDAVSLSSIMTLDRASCPAQCSSLCLMAFIDELARQ